MYISIEKCRVLARRINFQILGVKGLNLHVNQLTWRVLPESSLETLPAKNLTGVV